MSLWCPLKHDLPVDSLMGGRDIKSTADTCIISPFASWTVKADQIYEELKAGTCSRISRCHSLGQQVSSPVTGASISLGILVPLGPSVRQSGGCLGHLSGLKSSISVTGHV